MPKFLATAALALFSIAGYGQTDVRFAFYNAENMFDILLCPGKDDGDFTPQGSYAWDAAKYNTKIDHIARVVADLNPGILALAEIENEKVLSDLAAAVSRKNGVKYAFVHRESGDSRGIDPALLYRPDVFSPCGVRMLRSPVNERGILYVKGVLVPTGDTLHVFVNHWTSRYQGQKATEAARIDMGRLLGQTADSLHKIHPEALVFAGGDLNDTPDEKSVHRLLSEARWLHPHNRTDTRTYYYRGEWLSFDQLFTNFASGVTRVFSPAYLLGDDGSPLRTFSGPVYRGGYSDHLPVYIDAILVKK